jgi:putative tryptophan/tyrosine transport system substrate-binding protein
MTLLRRDFITLLGGAAAWPLAARAQQTGRMRQVGVLLALSEDDQAAQARLAAFRQALAQLGWIEGRNVRFETRWAGGDIGRLRAYAAELVERAPDVILGQGTPSTAALKQATSSIPVVFVVVNDPVAQGYVPSVAHPGGNITGFSYIDYSMLGKSVELFKRLAPGLARIAFMFNPDSYPYYETYLPLLVEQLRRLSLDLTAARVRSESEIEAAFAKLAGEPGNGVVAAPDPFMNVHRALMIRLSTERRVPVAFNVTEAVSEGGLMFYGPDMIDIMRRSASYVDRILKGANPGELPVQAPTKFYFAVNLRTAKALGLDPPPTVLAIADEVIE